METTTKAYIYNRKDGGTTFCYGKLLRDSNLYVTCDDEYYDGIVDDNEHTTWHAVCAHLETFYNTQIEEISAI